VRAVHVGDAPESDVGGARAVGLRTVRVPYDRGSVHDATPGGHREPTHTVGSLAELVDPPRE